MKQTLDQTNPAYFDLVRERTEEKTVLDCFIQTRLLLAHHAPIAHCLDVGCASGYLRHHIGDLVGTYHGLDASPAFVRYGREALAREGVENAEIHHGWFETFSPPQPFDALICLGLFYIFPNFHSVLDRMMAMTRKAIVIRSLFAEKTEIRYVPEMPGSETWTYYNIYGVDAVTRFIEERNWQARWHEDDYVQRVGGYYETAGLPFPFKFLELVPQAMVP
ncbi:MAG: class I SAM-dependent methyltransferase [Desulfobacterales bacterium]|nr:class I SAM-dependent methyltransferase [Desulfobacterales bacterium]